MTTDTNDVGTNDFGTNDFDAGDTGPDEQLSMAAAYDEVADAYSEHEDDDYEDANYEDYASQAADIVPAGDDASNGTGTTGGAGGSAPATKPATVAGELADTEPLERPRGMVDEEAEVAVIAAVLTDAESYYDVNELLTFDDFASPALSEVWRAVMACEAQGRAIDKLTVADELTRAGSLGKVGGLVRLDDLTRQGSGLSNVVAYAEIVADRALARRVAHSSRDIYRQATNTRITGDDAVEFAEKEIFQIRRQKARAQFVEMDDAVKHTLADLANARDSLLVGHSTGFAELDRLTGGVQGGQLITVAARPAMGKSAMALALARNIAESTGDRVVFLSYEMSQRELTLRLLSSMLGVELHRLRQGQIPAEMGVDLAAHAKRLAQTPLTLSDNPPETVSGVRAAMRRLARRTPLAAIVVDYMQLMQGDRRSRDENRVQEVSEISRGLKQLARELDVPVIALSQLSRGVENRGEKRPILSDLRESGSIEQDSDTVWFIYRDWVYNPSSDQTAAELLIAKQRQGPAPATVHLKFTAGTTRFEDQPPGYQPPRRSFAPSNDGNGNRGGGGFF